LQAGQLLGPQVGTLQPHVRRRGGIVGACPLGRDVDLLAPVGLALGEFARGAGVAAEARAAQHLDPALVLQGSAKVVQEHLGHSSYAITAGIYSHVGPAQQREAADRLDQALRW
jgi:hypothetical protein